MMRRDDFKIGVEFRCGSGQWRCTDIGTRTIVAIRLDQVRIEEWDPNTSGHELRTLSRGEAEKDGWLNGPPYCTLEEVFDEDEMWDCDLLQEVAMIEKPVVPAPITDRLRELGTKIDRARAERHETIDGIKRLKAKQIGLERHLMFLRRERATLTFAVTAIEGRFGNGVEAPKPVVGDPLV